MHQGLCRVPNNIADGLFRVDAQQVLQYAEEWNALWGVGHLIVGGGGGGGVEMKIVILTDG